MTRWMPALSERACSPLGRQRRDVQPIGRPTAMVRCVSYWTVVVMMLHPSLIRQRSVAFVLIPVAFLRSNATTAEVERGLIFSNAVLQ